MKKKIKNIKRVKIKEEVRKKERIKNGKEGLNTKIHN